MLFTLFRNKLVTILFLSGVFCLLFGVYRLLPGESSQATIVKDNKKEQNIKSSSTSIQNNTTMPTISVAPATPDSPKNSIKVDVSGAVDYPGVYNISPEARIQDALYAAGGLSSTADLTWVSHNLNLAVPLNDGDKIYIPDKNEIKTQAQNLPTSYTLVFETPSINNTPIPQVAGLVTSQPGLQSIPTSTPQSTQPPLTDTKISVNNATTNELDTLPGVGPVTAGKIISNRPYTSLEELKDKKAVNNSTFEKIKDLVKL